MASEREWWQYTAAIGVRPLGFGQKGYSALGLAYGQKINGLHPALKHGAYSGATVLPGEDSGAFERLHNELVVEFTPAGPLERDIVANIARLVWRKQNLRTYRLAALARDRIGTIRARLVPSPPVFPLLEAWNVPDTRDPEDVRAAEKAADEQAKKELGDFYELASINVTTFDSLEEELALIDRLDGMIDRCIKRLLLVRGVKSLSSSVSEPASAPAPKRVASAQ
jgi:hypothetical protein